ncbi:MAG: M42 family metallopeptidase [Bacillota bacterium]
MLLKQLSEASGVSGNEGEVRDLIRAELQGKVTDVFTDTTGNLIARKGSGRPVVMLAAHMDEIGLLVNQIEKSGLIRFVKVGGIDDRVLPSKTVLVGKDKVPGVIGSKAIHLQEPKERETPFKWDQLYIDIGAKSKEEAEKRVKVGDYASFNTSFAEFGDGCCKGKAMDDRAGCQVLLDVLRENYPFTLYGAFTVQEEVGLRGAGVAAYRLEPDLALVLEGTICADIPGADPEYHATTLGGGPVISLMDAGTIHSRKIIDLLVQTAKRKQIPYQFRRAASGGNDAGRIHLTKAGVPSGAVSVPCRYIHSPVSVVKASDLANATKLVVAFLKAVAEGGFKG